MSDRKSDLFRVLSKDIYVSPNDELPWSVQADSAGIIATRKGDGRQICLKWDEIIQEACDRRGLSIDPGYEPDGR